MSTPDVIALLAGCIAGALGAQAWLAARRKRDHVRGIVEQLNREHDAMLDRSVDERDERARS